MAIGTGAQMARASRIANASNGSKGSVDVSYGTGAQMARAQAIGGRASGNRSGMGTVQAMMTSAIPDRIHGSGGNRRQVQSSRRLAGMPQYMVLPKRAMTYSGPDMIMDTAQSGK
jgi:hypothetical protein